MTTSNYDSRLRSIGGTVPHELFELVNKQSELSRSDVVASIDLISKAAPSIYENDTPLKAFAMADLQALRQKELEAASKHMSEDSGKLVLDKVDAYAFLDIISAIWSKRLQIINGSIWIKELDGHWTESHHGFTKQKCHAMLPKVFQAVIPYTFKQLNTKFMCDSCYTTLEKSQIDMTSIQFSDCAMLANGKIVESCDEVPRVTIEKPVKDAIAFGKPTTIVPELIEFLHEAIPDEDILDLLLDRLAMTLVLDPSRKQSLGKACMLYGPTAQNGKSLLIWILMKALKKDCGNQMYRTFNLAKFEGYDIAALIDSILLINDDGTGEFIEAKVSTNLKSAITAGPLTVRQIYKEPVTVIPTVQLVCAMNALPISEDKTEGLDRRFEWFPFMQKIDGDKSRDEWFAKVKSDDAALMFLQMLAIRAVRIAKTGELVKFPQSMRELSESYGDANRNVKTWLDQLRSEDELLNWSVKMSYDKYVEWCDDSAETPMGKKKFTSSIMALTSFKRKSVHINENSYPEIFLDWQHAKDKFGNKVDSDRQFKTDTTMIMWVR